MVRPTLFLLLLAALCASGYTLVQKDFRPTSPTAAKLSPPEAATRRLSVAADALERYHRLIGSYEGAHLEAIKGLRLVRADEWRYCVEAGDHALAGPHGAVYPGRCSG